jgi:hypothetical protein
MGRSAKPINRLEMILDKIISPEEANVNGKKITG